MQRKENQKPDVRLTLTGTGSSIEYVEKNPREILIDIIAKGTRNARNVIFHAMLYEIETSLIPLTEIDALKIVAANYNATGKYKIDITGVA